MNKNQKHQPYTYTKLIQGNRFSAMYHKSNINRLEGQKRKLERNSKPVPSEVIEGIKYHKTWLEYFEDEYARFSMCRIAGDECTLIR